MTTFILKYSGPYDNEWRDGLYEEYLEYIHNNNIEVSEDYSLRKQYDNELKINKWISLGIPNDEFTINNCMITEISDKWAYLIDPQSIGNKWLKNTQKK